MDNSKKAKKALKIQFNIDSNQSSPLLTLDSGIGSPKIPNSRAARIRTRKFVMSAPSDFPDDYDSSSPGPKKSSGSPSRVRFSEFLPPGMDDDKDPEPPKALVKEKVSMDAFYADLEFIRRHMRANASSPDLSPNTSVTAEDDMDSGTQVPTNNPPTNESSVHELEATKPSLQIQDVDKAIALFDWISPYTPNSTPNLQNSDSESASQSAVSVPQVNLQSNSVVYSEATSNSFPIEKSRLLDSESASFWDYIPPAPERIHDCEVDSGNVDALVSHVLQQSLPSTTDKKSESQSSSLPGKSKSSFLNPGISINFNYSPIFSNPLSQETSAAASAAGWTWNKNQQTAVSPSRVQTASSSAYFPPTPTTCTEVEGQSSKDQVSGRSYVDVGTETDEEEEVKVQVTRKVPRHPYLQQLSSSVSDISLVPLVNSVASVPTDTGSQEDPEEHLATDCDEIETESIDPALLNPTVTVALEETSGNETNDEVDGGTASPLGSRIIEILNQFNAVEECREETNENKLPDEVVGGTASPLGSRIIEILNQFNKVEEEIGFPTIRLGNETQSSSRRRSAPSVNLVKSGSRTSSNSVHGSNKEISNSASAPSSENKLRSRGTKSGKSPVYKAPRSKTSGNNISEAQKLLEQEFVTVPPRNIVRENIVLAKYPIRQISGSFRTLRTAQKSSNSVAHPRNPSFIPILVETQRIPAPPTLRHSRSRPKTTTTPKFSNHHFHVMSHSRQLPLHQNSSPANPVHQNSFKGTLIDSKRSTTDPGKGAPRTQSKTGGSRRIKAHLNRSVDAQYNGGDQNKTRTRRSRSGSTTYNNFLET